MGGPENQQQQQGTKQAYPSVRHLPVSTYGHYLAGNLSYLHPDMASADEPSEASQNATPNHVTDFQQQYNDLAQQIFQRYQQRVQNEGLTGQLWANQLQGF